MCGIIAYSGPRLAAPILVEGLRRLEYRGYDSAGVALLDPQRTPIAAVTRSEGKIAALASKLEAEPPSGTTGIGPNLISCLPLSLAFAALPLGLLNLA